MKCELCGVRDAVLYVQQVTANRTIEMHICLECAKARGISTVAVMQNKTPQDNFLSGLFQDADKRNGQQNKVCPVCGQTLADLQRLKSAGCPECYTVFKSEVFSVLKSSGLEGTYHGPLPKRLAHFRSVLTDRMIFQEKLADAVAVEDYEKAALYRDRLRALNTRSASTDYTCGDDDE